MWQHRRGGVIMMAGLLGMTLTAGARGGRAAAPGDLCSVLALAGTPGARGLPAAGPGCFSSEPRVSPTLSDAFPDPVSLTGGFPGAETPFRAAWVDEPLASTSSPAAPFLNDLSAALSQIRAAAAGSWSLGGETPAGAADPRPAPDPIAPLLPTGPAAPDPRALLAAIAMPAGGLLRPLRRRGRRIAGAVTERLTTALGLLLIVLWGRLRRG
jgi:hypothetical protein